MLRLAPRARKTLVITVLMALSGLTLWAPSGYSDGLKHLMQLLVPFQSPLYRSGWTMSRRLREADARRPALDGANGQGPHEEAAAPDSSPPREALENTVVALSEQLEQVRLENGRLKGLRDRYIPPGVRLISAPVVAPDVSAWRDALLLARGSGLESDKKVRKNDLVASRLFVGAGEEAGARVGHLVLAREYLLGEIEQASPFVSRVRLFSDVGARTEVRIGRNVQARGGLHFQTVNYPCTLLGRGRGEMVIEHVPERFIVENPTAPPTTGAIREGDLVVSVPRPPALPTAMVIGYIRSSDRGRTPCFERDPRRPLVATVHVRAALSPEDISDVFIIAAGPDR